MKSMIKWFGIPTLDFDRALKFYNTIFDIKMIEEEDKEGGYRFANFFDPKEGMSGCIHSEQKIKPGKEGPRIYLDTFGKIDEVLARVGPAGGNVIGREDVGEYGVMALIEDTEGNYIGLRS